MNSFLLLPSNRVTTGITKSNSTETLEMRRDQISGVFVYLVYDAFSGVLNIPTCSHLPDTALLSSYIRCIKHEAQAG